MKLILTGSSIPAQDLAAHMPGLKVCPRSSLRREALECAKSIASKSTVIVALAKQAILAGKVSSRNFELFMSGSRS